MASGTLQVAFRSVLPASMNIPLGTTVLHIVPFRVSVPERPSQEDPDQPLGHVGRDEQAKESGRF